MYELLALPFARACLYFFVSDFTINQQTRVYRVSITLYICATESG